MTMDSVAVNIAVEGQSDVPIAMRLLELVGLLAGPPYVSRGKDKLDEKLNAYNHAAKHSRWLVLRDLDRDAPCAPELCRQLLPAPSAHMHLRIAVRASEAWLLGDQENLSRFLKVGTQHIPSEPDALDNPKRALIDVARLSRDRAIKEDMVPQEGTGTSVGPGYTARIIEFSSHHWEPLVAAQQSPSLRRCILALQHWSGARVIRSADSVASAVRGASKSKRQPPATSDEKSRAPRTPKR
ncbi:hypothetical protein [Chondromyces apiculatus]|uniref:hypothetical protein n=1 Tax=Chondromyces apiculatus TaxID=51 RepID=UPI0012DFA3FE|nr:hypothetical protein [Chondromyces apiculatus]